MWANYLAIVIAIAAATYVVAAVLERIVIRMVNYLRYGE